MRYDVTKIGYVPRVLKLDISAAGFKKFLIDKMIISEAGEPSEPMLDGEYMVVQEDLAYPGLLSAYATSKGLEYFDKIYKANLVRVNRTNRKRRDN